MAKSIIAQGFKTLTTLYETVQVKLTNEVVAIPCSNLGVPAANALAGASTTVEVMMGASKLDASQIILTILTNSPSGVTSSLSGNNVTITAIPSSLTTTQGYVDISVSAKIANGTQFLGAYRFSFVKQLQGNTGSPGTPGSPGPSGISYTLNVLNGVRGVAYSAMGTAPEPTTSTAFSVSLLKNGVAITPFSYSWSCGGNLSGTSTAATFTPIVSSTYASISTFVKVVVKESSGGSEITETIPIICTKHADGLDWIANWNSQAVVLGSDKLISPKIFAGTKNASNQLTGVALGRDVLGGNSNNIIGLVGYKNNKTVFSLDQNANFFVSSSGNAGDIQNGINNARGLYFDGTNFYLSGKVTMTSGSSIPSDTLINGTTASTVVSNASTGVAAKALIDNLSVGSRNLVLNSKLDIANSTSYLITQIGLSVDLVSGKKYTIVIDGKSQGTQKLGVWMNGGSNSLGYFSTAKDGVEYITFTAVAATTEADKRKLSIYNYPSSGTTAYPASIRWVSLYEGDIRPSLDWNPAPEDAAKGIVDAQTAAEGAAKTAEGALSLAGETSDKVRAVTLVDGDSTVVDGGKIKTGSLTANSIAAGNFRIINADTSQTTFEVEADGNVNMWGNVQSFNYTPGARGWSLKSDGNAEFNNSIVRSSIMLPSAGITNAYDMNQLYGRNLFKKTSTLNNLSGTPTKTHDPSINGFNVIATATGASVRISEVIPENDVYTFSAYVKSSVAFSLTIDICDKESQSFAIGTSWTRVVKTATVNNYSAATYHFIDLSGFPIGTVNFKDVKIERGSSDTEYTPAPENDSNPVRFWAGTNFENRDIAPFKVYQNGDIIVERGTFKGTVSGQLDVGKIYIDEDEISVYKYSRDTQVPNYLAVRINDAATYFNVDKFTIGSGAGVEKLSLEGNKDLMTLSNVKTIMSNSNGSELILNETATNQFNILKTKSSFTSGGTHTFKYYNGYSGLILESTSASSVATGGEIPYDFKFENPTKGSATVKIAGTLMVSDKITMRNQTDVYIESKDGSDGFGKGFDIIVI